MISLMQVGGRFPRLAAAVLGVWIVAGSSANAGDGMVAGPNPGPGMVAVVPGDGGAGFYPGFQGFGLGWHLGYGYGGNGLGVGPDGGYPFYGGPGYPHPWPTLRRLGRINPFPYFGGPGYPTPSCPNYFGGVGPLAVDQPVIEIEREPEEADLNTGYGGFTGVYPYPESFLAPFTVMAAQRGSASGVSTAQPAPGPTNTPAATGVVPSLPASDPSLGIDAEPVASADGTKGMKITKVHPAGAAEKASLHPGDVIRSVNGFLTEEHGNLAWIIANHAPDRVLKMNVVTAGDTTERTITVTLPKGR